MQADQVCIIIPSYNPDEKLRSVITDLSAVGFSDFIVVDDGSAKETQPFFPVEGEYPGVVLLRHEVNRGKGAALKTAFDYVCANRKDCIGVITVDGDNQHQAKDVWNCAEAMCRTNQVILGVRDFSQPDVPRRSRIGNRITSFVFRFACGIRISETQTGLRAIPTQFLPLFLTVSGDRYEYETNMLLEMKTENIPFEEVKITTVYIEQNATSHFHPIRDSIKIYKLILKYIFSSAISAILDVFLFWLFSALFGNWLGNATIPVCTVAARCISAFTNFQINRRVVFGQGDIKSTLWKYTLLACCQVAASSALVWTIAKLFNQNAAIMTTIFKVIVDSVLFFLSFKLQQNWIFKKEKRT